MTGGLELFRHPSAGGQKTVGGKKKLQSRSALHQKVGLRGFDDFQVVVPRTAMYDMPSWYMDDWMLRAHICY